MVELESKSSKKREGSPKSITQVTINVQGSLSTDESTHRIEEALRLKRLLREEYIYSAFHPSKLTEVLTKGTARSGKAVDGAVSSAYHGNDESNSIFLFNRK